MPNEISIFLTKHLPSFAELNQFDDYLQNPPLDPSFFGDLPLLYRVLESIIANPRSYHRKNNTTLLQLHSLMIKALIYVPAYYFETLKQDENHNEKKNGEIIFEEKNDNIDQGSSQTNSHSIPIHSSMLLLAIITLLWTVVNTSLSPLVISILNTTRRYNGGMIPFYSEGHLIERLAMVLPILIFQLDPATHTTNITTTNMTNTDTITPNITSISAATNITNTITSTPHTTTKTATKPITINLISNHKTNLITTDHNEQNDHLSYTEKIPPLPSPSLLFKNHLLQGLCGLEKLCTTLNTLVVYLRVLRKVLEMTNQVMTITQFNSFSIAIFTTIHYMVFMLNNPLVARSMEILLQNREKEGPMGVAVGQGDQNDRGSSDYEDDNMLNNNHRNTNIDSNSNSNSNNNNNNNSTNNTSNNINPTFNTLSLEQFLSATTPPIYAITNFDELYANFIKRTQKMTFCRKTPFAKFAKTIVDEVIKTLFSFFRHEIFTPSRASSLYDLRTLLCCLFGYDDTILPPPHPILFLKSRLVSPDSRVSSKSLRNLSNTRVSSPKTDSRASSTTSSSSSKSSSKPSPYSSLSPSKSSPPLFSSSKSSSYNKDECLYKVNSKNSANYKGNRGDRNVSLMTKADPSLTSPSPPSSPTIDSPPSLLQTQYTTQLGQVALGMSRDHGGLFHFESMVRGLLKFLSPDDSQYLTTLSIMQFLNNLPHDIAKSSVDVDFVVDGLMVSGIVTNIDDDNERLNPIFLPRKLSNGTNTVHDKGDVYTNDSDDENKVITSNEDNNNVNTTIPMSTPTTVLVDTNDDTNTNPDPVSDSDTFLGAQAEIGFSFAQDYLQEVFVILFNSTTTSSYHIAHPKIKCIPPSRIREYRPAKLHWLTNQSVYQWNFSNFAKIFNYLVLFQYFSRHFFLNKNHYNPDRPVDQVYDDLPEAIRSYVLELDYQSIYSSLQSGSKSVSQGSSRRNSFSDDAISVPHPSNKNCTSSDSDALGLSLNQNNNSHSSNHKQSNKDTILRLDNSIFTIPLNGPHNLNNNILTTLSTSTTFDTTTTLSTFDTNTKTTFSTFVSAFDTNTTLTIPTHLISASPPVPKPLQPSVISRPFDVPKTFIDRDLLKDMERNVLIEHSSDDFLALFRSEQSKFINNPRIFGYTLDVLLDYQVDALCEYIGTVFKDVVVNGVFVRCQMIQQDDFTHLETSSPPHSDHFEALGQCGGNNNTTGNRTFASHQNDDQNSTPSTPPNLFSLHKRTVKSKYSNTVNPFSGLKYMREEFGERHPLYISHQILPFISFVINNNFNYTLRLLIQCYNFGRYDEMSPAYDVQHRNNFLLTILKYLELLHLFIFKPVHLLNTHALQSNLTKSLVFHQVDRDNAQVEELRSTIGFQSLIDNIANPNDENGNNYKNQSTGQITSQSAIVIEESDKGNKNLFETSVLINNLSNDNVFGDNTQPNPLIINHQPQDDQNDCCQNDQDDQSVDPKSTRFLFNDRHHNIFALKVPHRIVIGQDEQGNGTSNQDIGNNPTINNLQNGQNNLQNNLQSNNPQNSPKNDQSVKDDVKYDQKWVWEVFQRAAHVTHFSNYINNKEYHLATRHSQPHQDSIQYPLVLMYCEALLNIIHGFAYISFETMKTNNLPRNSTIRSRAQNKSKLPWAEPKELQGLNPMTVATKVLWMNTHAFKTFIKYNDTPSPDCGINLKGTEAYLNLPTTLPGSKNDPDTIIDPNNYVKKSKDSGRSKKRVTFFDTLPETEVEEDTLMESIETDVPPTSPTPFNQHRVRHGDVYEMKLCEQWDELFEQTFYNPNLPSVDLIVDLPRAITISEFEAAKESTLALEMSSNDTSCINQEKKQDPGALSGMMVMQSRPETVPSANTPPQTVTQTTTPSSYPDIHSLPAFYDDLRRADGDFHYSNGLLGHFNSQGRFGNDNNLFLTDSYHDNSLGLVSIRCNSAASGTTNNTKNTPDKMDPIPLCFEASGMMIQHCIELFIDLIQSELYGDVICHIDFSSMSKSTSTTTSKSKSPSMSKSTHPSSSVPTSTQKTTKPSYESLKFIPLTSTVNLKHQQSLYLPINQSLYHYDFMKNGNNIDNKTLWIFYQAFSLKNLFDINPNPANSDCLTSNTQNSFNNNSTNSQQIDTDTLLSSPQHQYNSNHLSSLGRYYDVHLTHGPSSSKQYSGYHIPVLGGNRIAQDPSCCWKFPSKTTNIHQLHQGANISNKINTNTTRHNSNNISHNDNNHENSLNVSLLYQSPVQLPSAHISAMNSPSVQLNITQPPSEYQIVTEQGSSQHNSIGQAFFQQNPVKTVSSHHPHDHLTSVDIDSSPHPHHFFGDIVNVNSSQHSTSFSDLNTEQDCLISCDIDHNVPQLSTVTIFNNEMNCDIINSQSSPSSSHSRSTSPISPQQSSLSTSSSPIASLLSISHIYHGIFTDSPQDIALKKYNEVNGLWQDMFRDVDDSMSETETESESE